MNLSVSNIAWNKNEEEDALNLLLKYDIRNLEIAPTLLFESLSEIQNKDVQMIKTQYTKKGFSFVSMQSLLYDAPNYSIFEEEDKVNELLGYLKK